MRLLAAILLVACTDSDDPECHCEDTDPSDTDTDPVAVPAVSVTQGPTLSLTDASIEVPHHHSTVAWAGAADTFAVAYMADTAPPAHPLVMAFDHDGAPFGPPVDLAAGLPNPFGEKPDIEWGGDRFVVGFENDLGNVFLRPVDATGVPLSAPVLLADSTDLEPTMTAEAVDLAVHPDGSGVAIWTESDAPWMDEDEGQIVWRAFDATLAADGPSRIAMQSSRKASDASTTPDGGWVGVWAIHYDHPTDPLEVYYETWGRITHADGASGTFRADDLDAAWPSRPAVAVSDTGLLSVSFRDKTASEGDSAGTFGRIFDPDGTPQGPSFELSPGGDGDRVITAWVEDLALYSWQESDGDGLAGVWLSAVHAPTRTVLVDKLAIHDPGEASDERPSFAVRPAGDAWEVVYVWETFLPGGEPTGIRARVVTITIDRSS
jgi:hypothetical protein